MIALNSKIVSIIEQGWWIAEIDRHPNGRSWIGKIKKGHNTIVIKDATDVPHLISMMRKAIHRQGEK